MLIYCLQILWLYIICKVKKKYEQTCSYSLEAFNKGKRAVTAQNKGSFAIDPNMIGSNGGDTHSYL